VKVPLRLALIAVITGFLPPVSAAPSLPEYTAAEAPKHIGEKATVVGKVGCIDAGRTFHMLSLDGCTPTSPFWIIVNDNASGPDLNIQDLKDVIIAVTGKIEVQDTQPWLVVRSATQIQPRSALHTDHISRAHQKEADGDLDGAIQEFNQAVEHQPDRRNEAYEFIARIKERKGDWPGALATYDRLVELDPKKSGSYYVRATAKKQHGDFEGAMTDFTRAAELRSSGINLVEIGNMRKANGDSTGAMAEYDKAIAMLDSQIAGVQKPSDRLDLLYYHRGYAKELKGDVDGAVADYSQAIATKPSYEACAYSRRGDIKKARGDLAGAIADYQYAVKYAQLNEDKEKLNKAKAEVEREQTPLADSKSVYGDDKATAKLTRTAHGRAASEQHANSDAAADAESPTALVTRAKLRIRTGDFDGAIADCDRALQLSRGGSKEAYDLRIQAMKAKGTSKSAVAQRVNPGSSQEEQPIAPSTESGPAVAAGQARPKATSGVLVDPTSGQPIGRETHNGSVKVEYSDGRSEIFCQDGNCTDPHVSHEGHVGWTHYTHREGRYNAAMNERLVIRFLNGQTKEFKPNPNGGPFIEEWNFIDNDVAVAIKSRGYHGAASFVRYDLMSGRMTGHQDGYVEYEKMPEWAQPFSDDIPFGLRAPTTEPSPAASKPESAEVVDIPAAQVNFGIKAGNIKVRFSDGQSKILTRTGNCMEPKVSPTGHVGWTQCSGFDRKGYALNQKLIIHLRNGVAKEFKANPNAPFIVAWAFADNDSGVVIQSMSFHGPSSYIRYDLATEGKTNEKAGRDDSEPLPEWAQPVAKTLPEHSPAVKGRDGERPSLPLAAQQTERVTRTTEATSPQSSLPRTNILGSPAEPGIADVTALVEFTSNGSTNKGRLPNGLIFASDGNIYGTTERGGANDYGTIFKMTTAGAFTTLVEFAGKAPANSSGMPRAGLIEGRDGDFYGTTSGGGVGPTGENHLDNGTVFKLSRSGVLTTLVRFSCTGATNKGCEPYSGLVQAPNGDFYGTTFSGGSAKALPIPISHPGFRGFGTIFKITSEGALTTLIEFSVQLTLSKGGAPWAGLTLAKDGNFYGSTLLGGARHGGTIFKLTPKAAMTTLVNFSGSKPPNKGGGCIVELLQATDGNFYGTCPTAGAGNGGTVFKMTPSGAFTNLVEFALNDSRGVGPYAPLAEGNDGNLYGTTTAGGAFNCGTIFRVTPNGSFKVLWNFNNPNKIQQCEHPATGPLLKDKEGNFYGTTKWGGRTDWGTVFKLTLHNSGTQSSAVPTSNSSATAGTSDANGAMKIVSQKEPTSKMGSSQSGEQTSEDLGLNAAKVEYEHSSRDEAARVRYVTKLADIEAQLFKNYWATHNKEVLADAGAVNEELRKHPAPKNVDSRKLSQLLIGKWQSPRHIYVFRADGRYGVEDGDQRDKWRIDGNEYIDDVSRGPIVLLDDNYFIYAEGQGVAFYMRVKDSEAEGKYTQAAEKIAAADPRTLPEYTAAEAKKHMGETARVTDKVCEVSPRHWGGLHIGLGDCGPGGENVLFYAITYSDVIPGPKLDFEKLKGVVVTVTGKIKEYGRTGIASIDVKSTSQIVPRRQ